MNKSGKVNLILILILVLIISALIILSTTVGFVLYNKPVVEESVNQNKDSLIEEEILNEGKESDEIHKTRGGSIIELAINTSDKKVRWDNADHIMIAKVTKILPPKTYNNGEFRNLRISRVGEMEVIKELKGDFPNKNIKFEKFGGSIPLGEYIKTLKQEEIDKIFKYDSKKEKNKRIETEIIHDTYMDDIEIEEGKTYLMYTRYNKEEDYYSIGYLGDGLRELKPVKRSVVEKFRTPEEAKESSKEQIYVKNNETGKYENIEEVL